MKRVLKELKKKLNLNVNSCQIIYVGDRDLHIAAIKRNVGNVLFVKMWHDVKGFNELKVVLENIIRKEC